MLELLLGRVESTKMRSWLGFLAALADSEKASCRGDGGRASESLHRALSLARLAGVGSTGGGRKVGGTVQERCTVLPRLYIVKLSPS